MNNSKKLTTNMHILVFPEQPHLQSIREHILRKIMRTSIDKMRIYKGIFSLGPPIDDIFPRALAQRQLNKP